MPETRRDLFKTSVLSALSGFVASGVAGCTPTSIEGCPTPPAAPPHPGSVVAMHDYKKPAWYLFHFGAERKNCNLYTTCKESVPHEKKADTTTWLSVAGTLATKGTTIHYKTKNDTGTLVVDLLDSKHNYYLAPDSLAALLKLVDSATLRDGSAVAGSWYEIGKQ